VRVASPTDGTFDKKFHIFLKDRKEGTARQEPATRQGSNLGTILRDLLFGVAESFQSASEHHGLQQVLSTRHHKVAQNTYFSCWLRYFVSLYNDLVSPSLFASAIRNPQTAIRNSYYQHSYGELILINFPNAS
jgi:hypothetical protein